MEYTPSFRDRLSADIQPSYNDSLTHHGIKGMHWGVRRFQHPDGSYTALGAAKRKQLSKIDRKYDKLARKDAKEYARAKMSYGEGAGNRRKLIKNKVEQRRKENEHYNEAFDEYLAQEDMSKHADAAKRERTAKDAAKTTKRAAKTAVKVFNTVAPLLHDDETDAYLAHHGIKGMHWGVRRYQNPDGSLTDAGQKRYNKLANKGDKLRKLGVSDKPGKLALTRNQRIGYSVGSVVTPFVHPAAFGANGAAILITDANNKRAIRASKQREEKQKREEYRKRSDDLLKQHRNTYRKAQTDRENAFKKVYGKDAKIDYMKIYTEMSKDKKFKNLLNSEDPDDYRAAEAAWRKKHGV